MKTFLKVALIIVAALIAVKLLPLTFVLGCVLGVALIALAVTGVSVVAVLVVMALLLAAVLSPLWIPVLLLVGIIALVKRSRRARA